MTRVLLDAIRETQWIDTHEHLVEERHRLTGEPYRWTPAGEDEEIVLPVDWTVLISLYAIDDLVSAGLDPLVARRVLVDEADPLEKWSLVEPYFEAARMTGYLRAVDLTTERLFGRRLSRESCEEIDAAVRALRRPGYYRSVLNEAAGVDWCQVNSLEESPFCVSDMPDLLQQDIGLFPLVMGTPHPAEAASGIEVRDLEDYLQVIEWCFERYARSAVAVKCQWAYVRDLAVVQTSSERPRLAFDRVRSGNATPDDHRLVEDYLFLRCVALATEFALPVKLHLGYMAGNSAPRLRDIAGHVTQVTPLVQRHPATNFVLMHAAWPQSEQLIALAKHCPNVVVDLCFAWLAAPVSTNDFVRRFLTAVPASKLLCFGGDYVAVEPVVGHAEIARQGLASALAGLVADGWIEMEQAVDLVPALMRGNALSVLGERRLAAPIATQ